MTKRKYKMTQRARTQERTRQKIVQATADLHGSIGPRDTSISAVADKAGVQRLTVYRHFPTEESLFLACSAHWLAENPPPSVADWLDQEDAEQRTAEALGAFYGYYRRTSSMWRLVYRDIDQVPAMRAPLDAFHEHLDAICENLVSSWQPKGRKSTLLRAAVRHVVTFSTWESLDRLGLSEKKMVELALRWVAAAQPASAKASA